MLMGAKLGEMKNEGSFDFVLTVMCVNAELEILMLGNVEVDEVEDSPEVIVKND